MRLILTFARMYPRQSLITLGCLLLAAVAEGLGLSTLLPFLGLATAQPGGAEEVLTKGSSPLSQTIGNVLTSLGLELTIGTLLFVSLISAETRRLYRRQSRHRFTSRAPTCGTRRTLELLPSSTGWRLLERLCH
jgi:hypothetical protein